MNNNANTSQNTTAATALNNLPVTSNNNSIAKQNAAASPSPVNSTTATNSKKENKQTKLPWTIELLATTAYADKQTYDVVKEQTIGMAAPIPPPQPKPSLWSNGAGVRVGIPVTKKITVKTGLQFQQTRQQADYQQQNVVDMVSVRGGDTTRYRQIVYETEKQQSTYNAFNIPVLVSYQTGKKIKVGATAGAIINAYSWYTGKVPDATYSATLDAKDTYRNNTGVALYAGITIAKKVGTVEVFAEPHLQYSLSNITKPGVSFKQKINTYGLSIGVRTLLHK